MILANKLLGELEGGHASGKAILFFFFIKKEHKEVVFSLPCYVSV